MCVLHGKNILLFFSSQRKGILGNINGYFSAKKGEI